MLEVRTTINKLGQQNIGEERPVNFLILIFHIQKKKIDIGYNLSLIIGNQPYQHALFLVKV